MPKRITVFLLMLILSITVSSCGQSSAYGLWKNMCDTYPEQQGAVTVISDDDQGNYHIEYKGQQYNIDELSLFEVRENINEIHEEDILIGWDSLPFGMWYLDKYYSDTTDNPVFIYMSRLPEVYLRSDYDYKTDTFVLKGTDHTFVFSDMLTLSNEFSYSSISHYTDEISITLHSNAYPRLQISLRLFYVNDVWFAGGNSNSALFKISDEFLSVLTLDTCVKAE